MFIVAYFCHAFCSSLYESLIIKFRAIVKIYFQFFVNIIQYSEIGNRGNRIKSPDIYVFHNQSSTIDRLFLIDLTKGFKNSFDSKNPSGTDLFYPLSKI